MMIDAELEREKLGRQESLEREKMVNQVAVEREKGAITAGMKREESQMQIALRRQESEEQMAFKREQGDLDRQSREAMSAQVKSAAGASEATSKRQGEQSQALGRVVEALAESSNANADMLARVVEESTAQISEAVQALAMPKTVALDDGRTGTVTPSKPVTAVRPRFDAHDAINALVKIMAGLGEQTKKLGETVAQAMEESGKRQGEQAEALGRAAEAMAQGNKANADVLARASEAMEDSAMQISEAVRVLAMPKRVMLDNGRSGTIGPA